jgi:hypothetical protein
MLGVTSVEPAFSFFPRSDHPGADVIAFIDAVLDLLERGIPDTHGWVGSLEFRSQGREIMIPAGYLSLRVTGETKALLGMERFDRNGMVELSLFGNPDDYALMRRVEQLALEMGGALHWGQSNGLMTIADVSGAYSPSAITKWQSVQEELGGRTFTNFFMKRSGLVPGPFLRLDSTHISFDVTPAGETTSRSLLITNVGSGDLTVSFSAPPAGPFRWPTAPAVIRPGSDRHVLEGIASVVR